MKSEAKHNDIETNMGSGQQFRIKADGMAFKILSSALYSDAILAIVRELSCNAYDAHRAAGKADIPFYLHFPTVWEPHFEVHDYGIGLSEDQIMSLYTSYFDSNKRDDNLDTGMFGLGSKTPFAYTDSFTIISRYGGRKYTFMAYLGEDGTPRVNKVNEQDTDESNGLSVSMPVQRSDFNAFRDRAKTALEFFQTFPETNFDDFEVTPPQYTLEGEDWGLRGNYDYVHTRRRRVRMPTGGIRAIQGNVPYPIKVNMLNEKYQNIDGCFDLYFDIGEVEPQPSREELHYDEKTIRNIEAKLDKVLQNFQETAQEKIDDCDSLWEARKAMKKLYNELEHGVYRSITCRWNGISLSNLNCTWLKSFNQAGLQVDGVSYNYSAMGSRNPIHKKMIDNVDLMDRTLVVFDDLKQGGLSRAKYFAKKNRIHNHHNSGKEWEILVIRNPQEEPALARLCMKYLGWPKWEKASNLEKPPTSSTANGTSNFYYVNEVHLEARTEDSIDFENEKGIYAVLKQQEFVEKDGTHSRTGPEIGRNLEMARKLKIIDQNMIYGFRTKDLKKIERNKENWTYFEDYILDNLDKIDPQALDDLRITLFKRELQNSGLDALKHVRHDLQLNNSYFKEFYNKALKGVQKTHFNNFDVERVKNAYERMTGKELHNPYVDRLNEFLDKNPVIHHIKFPHAYEMSDPIESKEFFDTIEPLLKE